MIEPSPDEPVTAGSGGPVSFAALTNGPEGRSDTPPTKPRTRPRGPDRKPRRRRGRTITAADEVNAAALSAIGTQKTKIAKVLDLSKQAVDALLARPGVADLRDKVREVIRTNSLAHIQQTQDQAWAWLAEAIRGRDPRAFDAITRGLAALERTAASASGENRTGSLAITHEVGTDLTNEAKDLLAALLGPLRGESEGTPPSDPQ